MLQASWLSPYLCRGELPCGLPQAKTPSWGSSMAQMSALGRCAVSAGEPASGPGQGGQLAASQLGSKTSASSWVCNLHPAWALLFSCQFIGCFLSELVVLGMDLETEIASSSGWAPDILHGEERHGEGKITASPWFKDNPGAGLSPCSIVSLQQRGLGCLEAFPALFWQFPVADSATGNCQ